ncbi:MAG: ABC transporter ATP-binding protein [Patescibacteria group bacterium]|jgi:ABC-type sulfate/molybdate transport systems ATPase subunit
MNTLSVQHCSVTINHKSILQDVSFDLFTPEIISIIGPSGSGKSTLLRSIASWQKYSGNIILSSKIIGWVEQQSTLFPHLTVFENIAYPLKIRHISKNDLQKKVTALLERFGITDLAKRLPQQLSGGEQQRVSIARALIYEPNLLLLDEPFGSLDALWKYDMLNWLKNVLHERPIPTLFVTHDQREARFISNRVICLANGNIAYDGAWADIQACTNPTVQQLLAKAL